MPEKTIWLYTGYRWEEFQNKIPFDAEWERNILREKIVKQCDVLVDGRYIDSQRDVSLKWRGSSNQRVIDVKKSLQENKITLYCD